MRMNRNISAPPLLPVAPSAEILALRTNWKWAYLSHFLFTYNPVLHLEDIQLSELETDLASGTFEVIPTVMQRLLMSLTPHDKRMILDNWQQQLRKQSLKRSPDHNLMGTEESPIHFASLIMSDKLDLFHALCEWQFHNPNNLRARMRDDDEYANWRMEPIAYDAKGNGYWLMGGNRLWIHYAPPRKRAAKSHKRKQPATTSTNGRKSAKRRQPQTASTSTVIAAASATTTNAKSKPSALSATGRPIRETRSKAQQAGSSSRAMGTRVSSRLRGRVEEDIWQPIPEEWLKEANDGVDDKDQSAHKGNGPGMPAENENPLNSLDDVSELTSLSDLSELPEADEETNDEEDFSDPTPTPTPELSSSKDAWETLCVTLSEWEEFPQRFENSTHRAEKAFYKLLVNELVPAITEVLRVDVRKKVIEEAVVHRKRSSRIAVKESVREAERAEARRRAEEEKEMERHRRWETRARKEEEERLRRENLRSTRLREKGRTGSESVDVDIISESESKPALTNGVGSGVHEQVTTAPVKFVVNASKSGTQTPKDDDSWELDCEICRRRGMNLDDGQELMCCEKCNKWQHIRCHDQADFIAGRPRRNWELVDFLCAACAMKRQGSSQQQSQRPNPGPQVWTDYNASKINNGIVPMTSPPPVPTKPAYNQALYETVPHSNGRTSYASPLAPVQQTNSTTGTLLTQYALHPPSSTTHSVYPGVTTPQPRVLAPVAAPAPAPTRAPYPSGPNMYLSSSYSGGNYRPAQAAAQPPQPSTSAHYRSTVPAAPVNAWSQQQVHYSQLASHQGAWNGTAHAAGTQPSVGQPLQQNGYYRPHPPPPVSTPLPPPKHLPPAQQYYTGGPSSQS